MLYMHMLTYIIAGRLPLRTGFYQNTYPGRNAYTPQQIMGGIPNVELLIPEILATVGYRLEFRICLLSVHVLTPAFACLVCAHAQLLALNSNPRVR